MPVSITTHPLVTAVLGSSEPPPDKIVLYGYFGPSKQEDHWRLYLGLDFKSYCEIPEADILANDPVVPDDENSPSRVIINANAQVQLVHVIGAGGADFLAGGITASLLTKAAASAPFKEALGLTGVLGSGRPSCHPCG
jgi:hypothetical protein